MNAEKRVHTTVEKQITKGPEIPQSAPSVIHLSAHEDHLPRGTMLSRIYPVEIDAL